MSESGAKAGTLLAQGLIVLRGLRPPLQSPRISWEEFSGAFEVCCAPPRNTEEELRPRCGAAG